MVFILSRSQDFIIVLVCAISSRFYSKRPDLFQQAMRLAQSAAGQALISGKKDVEMCHGYILLSLYPVPAKRWEDQRSWLYLGLAIRFDIFSQLHALSYHDLGWQRS